MARIEWVDRRLREWAQWLTVGDGSGYPTKSTLHPEWSPPTPGITPTIKTCAPSGAKQVDRAVGMLSRRMSDTLVVHYCMQLSVADQAAKLKTQPATVHARIDTAHGLLARQLSEKGVSPN